MGAEAFFMPFSSDIRRCYAAESMRPHPLCVGRDGALQRLFGPTGNSVLQFRLFPNSKQCGISEGTVGKTCGCSTRKRLGGPKLSARSLYQSSRNYFPSASRSGWGVLGELFEVE